MPANIGERMRLLLATGNQGKAREIRQLLADFGLREGWDILDLTDLDRIWTAELSGAQTDARAGAQAGKQGLPKAGAEILAEVRAEVRRRYARLDECMAETGATFAENAALKAWGAARCSGLLTLAEDSGLEADWLGGAPGVYSARYAALQGSGTAADNADRANNALLLQRMRDAPADRRGVRYKAVMVLASAQGPLHETCGVCEGSIAFAPAGNGGFGYDPLFVLSGSRRTMAELSPDEKNAVSHRAKALALMAPVLTAIRKA